jgi:hypothetical protein
VRLYSLPLAFVLLFSFAVGAAAQNAAAPKTAQSRTSKHVWTNADLAHLNTGSQKVHVWTNKDMDKLRAKDLLSLVGPQPETENARTNQGAAGALAPVYNSRFEDPHWYEDQAVAIQSQIDTTQAALNEAQKNLDAALSLRQPFGGFHLEGFNILTGWPVGTTSFGITPQEGIANLEAQMRELQIKRDQLAELARKNGIYPGVLRVP